MKFIISLIFYEDKDKIKYDEIPDSIQKNLLNVLKSQKFKTYLEKNISNMGSACKNNVSHYLKLKIKTCIPNKKKSFLGLFGNSVDLYIDSSINKVKKKVVGEMWCSKTLNETEINNLFDEENLIEHFDKSLKDLNSGNPFKTIIDNKKKYYFIFKGAYI